MRVINLRTTVRLANTLERKWASPLRFRVDRSASGSTAAPSTNASMSSGNAKTSVSVPLGYGTGAIHVSHRDCTGNTGFDDFGSSMTGTFRDRSAEHAVDVAVRFESSIEARSASMESGF